MTEKGLCDFSHTYSCPGPGMDGIAPRLTLQCFRFATVRLIINRHRALSSVSKPRAFMMASQMRDVLSGTYGGLSERGQNDPASVTVNVG